MFDLERSDHLVGWWSYIYQIAEERLANNKTANHVSEFGSKLEIMGAAAEMAARRYLGINGMLHANFDGGTDFYWRGWSIDVKSTEFCDCLEYRCLQWPAYKPVKADIAMLMAVNMKQLYVVPIGFAFREDIESRNINESRRIPCREIPIPQLIPMRELRSIRKKRELSQGVQYATR